MLLYRIETNESDLSERVGPYRRNSGKHLATLALLQDVSNNAQTHPGPDNDAGLKVFWRESSEWRQYKFGFKNIDQYLNWFLFDEGREDLIGEAVLAIYEVPDMYYVTGQFQAIAHEDHMEHLYDLCPYTLERIV